MLVSGGARRSRHGPGPAARPPERLRDGSHRPPRRGRSPCSTSFPHARAVRISTARIDRLTAAAAHLQTVQRGQPDIEALSGQSTRLRPDFPAAPDVRRHVTSKPSRSSAGGEVPRWGRVSSASRTQVMAQMLRRESNASPFSRVAQDRSPGIRTQSGDLCQNGVIPWRRRENERSLPPRRERRISSAASSSRGTTSSITSVNASEHVDVSLVLVGGADLRLGIPVSGGRPPRPVVVGTRR